MTPNSPASNKKNMKLWILKPSDYRPRDYDPWDPWFDKVFGFVVRAETEHDARAIANSEAGNENDPLYPLSKYQPMNPWLSSAYSTCEELSENGEEGLVLKDMAMA